MQLDLTTGTHHNTVYISGAGIGPARYPDCAGFDDGWHTWIPEQEDVSVVNSGWSYSWPRGYNNGYLLSGTIETSTPCYSTGDFNLLAHFRYGADPLANSQYFGCIPYIRVGTNYYGSGWCRWKQSNGQIGYCIPELTGTATPVYRYPGSSSYYPIEDYLSTSMPLPADQSTVLPWFEMKRESGSFSIRSFPNYPGRLNATWKQFTTTSEPVYFGVMHLGNFSAGLTNGSVMFDLLSSAGSLTSGYWNSDPIRIGGVLTDVTITR